MKPDKDQFFKAIAKIERLSPAPRVLGKAITLLRDPDSEIDDIAYLIKSDPALVADMIRGANSIFYGGTERVASLERALQKIGFRESIRLLNLAVTRIVASRDLESYGITADDFWAESLFNGIFVKSLAMANSGVELDAAHTAGLLRFIGRLAINQCLKDCGCQVRWDGMTPLEAWELENVGFSSAQAGGLLLFNWRFPESLVQAIEWQNLPGKAPTPSWLADALHFTSAVLPQNLGLSFAVLAADYAVPLLPDTKFVKQHNLTPELIKEIVGTCRQDFISIANKLYAYERTPE
jgi:HD-like signal output (HDOD) protein